MRARDVSWLRKHFSIANIKKGPRWRASRGLLCSTLQRGNLLITLKSSFPSVASVAGGGQRPQSVAKKIWIFFTHSLIRPYAYFIGGRVTEILIQCCC